MTGLLLYVAIGWVIVGLLISVYMIALDHLEGYNDPWHSLPPAVLMMVCIWPFLFVLGMIDMWRGK